MATSSRDGTCVLWGESVAGDSRRCYPFYLFGSGLGRVRPSIGIYNDVKM